MFDYHRWRGTRRRQVYTALRAWGAWMLLPYWQPQVEGLENLPLEGPLVLVANHPTLRDPFLVAASGPRRLDFLVRHEVLRIPILGPLIARAGGVVIGPGRSGVKEALARLREGRPIALFPEAHQTHTLELQPFRGGAAMLAVRSGAPVVPLGLSGLHWLSTARGAYVEGGRIRARFGLPLYAQPDETPEGFGERLRLALEELITHHPPAPPRKHWRFRLAQALWVPTTWLIFRVADWWNPNNRR